VLLLAPPLLLWHTPTMDNINLSNRCMILVSVHRPAEKNKMFKFEHFVSIFVESKDFLFFIHE
jgi:hypothetical protein